MAEKKKYNSILVSGRKDETLTYSRYVKDEESGESVKESLDKKVNNTDELETQQIKDGAITNEKLAADSVGNTNLQDGSVSNEKLEDGSITNEKLAENSITKDKLKDNTIGVEKLDPELRQTINAATGLPENLVETIQNVDDTLKDHQRQLDDKQSQIDDKQQQITANDEDISLLQTRSTQMEETIKSIAATGGASQAIAVTYNNENSSLKSINAQAAIDELASKKFDKEDIVQEFGDSEDKVISQSALPFRIVENSKYMYAKTDAAGKMLLGFKKNGQPVFGVGVPEQIQKSINESTENVKNDINSDIDDKINLGSNIYPTNTQSVTENNKYKEVVISKDNKIVRGINKDNEEEIYLPQNFFGTKTISSIENVRYLEILFSRNDRMLSSRDKNGMLTEYAGLNAPFYLINGTKIRSLPYEDTIYVAAKDSDDTDKSSADYICDGINDEEEINEAIVALKKRSGLRYKKVVLFSGHYYIDSFPEVLGDWKSAIAFHSDNGMLGDSLTISGISHYYRSTVIYVTEKALNSISDNTKHSVIMCMPSTKDNSVVRFDVQNIMIALANNQHPIVAVNLQYGDCGECKNIYMTASGLYDNSESGIHSGTTVRDNAVDGVIALRSYHGYTIGDTVRFDNICAFGFYTAFQLGCEHAIYNNLRSRFCHTGYTFGEYHTELVRGAFDHPMTLINCCDEQSVQGPVFAWNGLIDRSMLETYPNEKDRKLQSVTFIDFNYETPSNKAYEVEPGTFCGFILYHPSGGTFGGLSDYSFWKEGSGKNFTTINLTQANGGTSELRKSYGAHYMQHFFDTDLNKEVIFNGSNWVDCLGNIVQ